MEIINSFEYARTMAVVEPLGEMHTFDVEHIILGGIVDWTARERSGNYEFKYISTISQNGAAAAHRFFQKIVDGVCTKALEDLFGAGTGFMLQYQIHDESEPVLKEDEYLVPTRITKESLITELETAIWTYGNHGFLSYKNLSAFDDVFLGIIRKLEVLHNSVKSEDALAAGREMVRILAHTENDDDYFPEYDINYVCETVDPYGLDQQLKDIVQEWRDSF